jgi:uncharacterized protein (DUF2147 family)
MKNHILTTLLFISIKLVSAQSIEGTWQTIDHETGKSESIVKIYKTNSKLYGDIIKILSNQTKEKKRCIDCPKPWKDKEIEGLNIITGLTEDEDGNWYADDGIFSPKYNKSYDCKIWVEDDILFVRAYIGFIYKTQKWIRVKNKNL